MPLIMNLLYLPLYQVKLNVTMNSLCEEPNPLGDEILFYSADGTESFRKLVEESKIATAASNAKKNLNFINMSDDDVHGINISSESNFDRIHHRIDNDISHDLQNKIKNDEKNQASHNDYNENENFDDENNSEDQLPNFNGSVTIRQQQKFLLNYAAEADELANNAADRLRMIYKIGMI